MVIWSMVWCLVDKKGGNKWLIRRSKTNARCFLKGGKREWAICFKGFPEAERIGGDHQRDPRVYPILDLSGSHPGSAVRECGPDFPGSSWENHSRGSWPCRLTFLCEFDMNSVFSLTVFLRVIFRPEGETSMTRNIFTALDLLEPEERNGYEVRTWIELF